MKSRAPALLLLALLTACGSKSDSELLAAAEARLAQRDGPGAVIELKNLLQQSPDNARGRLLLGRALLDGGDLAGAEIELRRALELGAPRDTALPLLAQALLNSGQSRKLISEFGAETLADPQAMSLLLQHLSSAYLAQSNLPEAKARAARALSLTPDAEGAQLAGVRVKLAAGQLDEAMDGLDRVLGSLPSSARALQLKAELLLARGRPDEAEPLLRQVLTLDPGSYEARQALLRLALGRQQLDVAARLVAEIPPELTKKAQGRFLQAQLALAQGDATKARDLSLPLLKLLPQYLPLLRLASAAQQQLGALPEAEGLLGQALKLAPDDPSLRLQYAGLQLQRRSPAQALDALRPLLDSGKAGAEVLMLAGRAQLLQGNFAAADQAFTAAAQQRPDDAKAAAALALTALVRDRAAPGGASGAQAQKALAQLREIAAKDSSGSYDLMLVSALMQRGDMAGASAAIDQLAPKMAGSPVPAALRGRLQLLRGDAAAAQASFTAALQADAAYLPAVLGLATLEVRGGKADAAVKRLEAFIEAHPQLPAARLSLAELLAKTGAPDERVTEVLVNAVRDEPAQPALRLALIDQRLRLGQVPAARQAAQEAVAALPQEPDLLERLARAQLAAGDRAQAGKTYNQLTTLAPSRASGWLGLAQLRFLDKDLAGAEREVKRALEAEPASANAQRLLIQLTLRQGRTDAGLAMLHERQKQLPQEAFGYIAEAEVELGRGRNDAGIALLRKAAALPEPADAAPRLYAALLAAKKRDEAFAFETQWLAAHPQDQAFASAAADLLLARGDLDAALSRYEALLKRLPDALPVINNVAWLRSQTGKPGARALAERGLKLDPDYAPLRDTYATVLAAERDFDRAISQQRQLVADQPDQPLYRLNLAQILLKAGRKADARVELEGLARLGDKFAQRQQVEALLKTL